MDGFIHGIVCAPSLVPVSEWLEVALGTKPKNITGWATEIVIERYVDVMEGLHDLPVRVSPHCDREGSAAFDTIRDWCQGFAAAVSLRHGEWVGLIESATSGRLITPILDHAKAREFGSPSGMPPLRGGARPRLSAEAIGDLVISVHVYWRAMGVRRD
jgi:yecA family protein